MEGILCTLNVIALKSTLDLSASENTGLPKLFEVIFILSFGYGLFSLVYIKASTKKFIFGFIESDNSVALAQLYTAYTLLDFICLWMMPLPTFCAAKFSLMTCYGLRERGAESLKLVCIGNKKRVICSALTVIVALAFDICSILFGENDRRQTNFAIFFVFSLLLVYNTLVVYILKIGKKLKIAKKQDLPRTRWLTSLFLTTVTPPVVILLICKANY